MLSESKFTIKVARFKAAKGNKIALVKRTTRGQVDIKNLCQIELDS